MLAAPAQRRALVKSVQKPDFSYIMVASQIILIYQLLGVFRLSFCSSWLMPIPLIS